MPFKRLNLRTPFIACVNSSADIRTICKLFTPFAEILDCAAATEGLATSVANTLRKFCAKAIEKLPLPQ